MVSHLCFTTINNRATLVARPIGASIMPCSSSVAVSCTIAKNTSSQWFLSRKAWSIHAWTAKLFGKHHHSRCITVRARHHMRNLVRITTSLIIYHDSPSNGLDNFDGIRKKPFQRKLHVMVNNASSITKYQSTLLYRSFFWLYLTLMDVLRRAAGITIVKDLAEASLGWTNLAGDHLSRRKSPCVFTLGKKRSWNPHFL